MGKDNYKPKVNITPATYSVLLGATKSQKAAAKIHAAHSGYGVPDMFKEFGHGVGKAYSEMSYREKVVYGLALFAVLGIVADNVANEGKYTKPVKDKLDKVYEKIVKKTPAVVIGADSPQSLAPTPAPTVVNGSAVKETAAPYQYDARIGNPDPAIPFIDIPEDKELADALQRNMDAWMAKSPKYTKEMPKYLVFREGSDHTPKDIDFTEDHRQIIYMGDKQGLIELIKKNIHWGYYNFLNHEIGHNKFKKDDGCNESKCIEMPAIAYDVEGDIDAGFVPASDREGRINRTWEEWKREHPNAYIIE